MYTEDLSRYRYYLPFPLDAVRCIGWIDAEHRYEKGRTPPSLSNKLEEIIVHRTNSFDAHVNVVLGIHPCNLCKKDIEIIDGGRTRPLGMSEIWIPCDPGWLAAPSLVLHYITDHGYLPPAVFIQSVMQLNIDNHFIGQEVYDRLVREGMARFGQAP